MRVLGEGASADHQPFYIETLIALAHGQQIAAYMATSPEADEPTVAYFTYFDPNPQRIALALSVEPMHRAIGALAGQILARQRGRREGIEPTHG